MHRQSTGVGPASLLSACDTLLCARADIIRLFSPENSFRHSGSLHIVKEFIVVLFIDQRTYPERCKGIHQAQQMCRPCGDVAVYNDVAYIGDIYIQGIKIEQLLHCLRVIVGIIEYSREIHKHQCEDVVEVLYILEDDEQCRENEAAAYIK